MKKKLFIFISLLYITPLQLHSINFSHYCQLSQLGKAPSSIAHTVNILLVAAKTTDCPLAFKRLNKMTYLSLANKHLTSIQPFYGITSLKYLDLSHNHISSLWGIEHSQSLQFLRLSQNKISDTTPLFFLKKLISLDLKENNLTSLIPLKNHPNLIEMDISLEGNPIFQDKEALISIERIKRYRLLFKLGLINNNLFENNGDAIMFLFDLIEQGNYLDFKNTIQQIVVSDQLIDDLPITDKRFLLSAKESEHVITSILNRIKDPILHYEERRLKLVTILELIILNPKTPLFNKKSLENLEEYLIGKISKEPSLIEPLLFFRLCQQWSDNIIKTGIPIGMKSGFNP